MGTKVKISQPSKDDNRKLFSALERLKEAEVRRVLSNGDRADAMRLFRAIVNTHKKGEPFREHIDHYIVQSIPILTGEQIKIDKLYEKKHKLKESLGVE